MFANSTGLAFGRNRVPAATVVVPFVDPCFQAAQGVVGKRKGMPA